MLEMGQPAAVRIQMLESVPSCLIFVNYPFFLAVHSLHRDFPRLSWRFPRQGRKDSRPTWPAISDIWLGIRTVPVPSVAKESRGASQIAHWPRSARTQAGRCGPTDRRSSVKKLLSFVRLLMFPSLLEEITGHWMPVECSKLTCFVKVKIRHGSRAVRSTIAVGRCQSSFAYCEAEFDLGKGKNRSKATCPH